MENNKEKANFQYTYSASEQEEIKRIRERYSPKEENKMERLRRLDRSVYSKARGVSITVGVIGLLTMGFGMSIAITDLGKIISTDPSSAMLAGILIGTVGGIVTAIAYPLYNRILKKERQKIASEIIKLSDELMK